VSPSIIRLPLSQRLSSDSLVARLTSQIAEQGLTYEDVLLRAVKLNTSNLNAALELPPGPLWRVDNALAVNGSAWMWSSSWFPRRLLQDPAGNWDRVTGLYGQLNQVMGEPRPVWRAISADAATIEDAEILGIRVSSPVLVRDGLTAGEGGEAMLRISRRARMDRVSYVLRYDQD
jgi:DNA-binding GntR family transcriptional regulator